MILFPVLTSCVDQNTIDISAKWKYNYGHNALYKDPHYNDSHWETTDITPKRIEKFNSTNIWFRKKITIPHSLQDETLGLYVGKVSSIDRTYLNGVCIGGRGSFHPDYHPTWNYERYYLVPKELLKYDGHDELAIHVSSAYSPWLTSTLRIGNYKDIENFTIMKRIFTTYIPIAVSLFSLLLGTAALLIYYTHTLPERPVLYFGLASLLWSLLASHHYVSDYGIPFALSEKIYYALMAVEFLLTFEIIRSILQLSSRITGYLIYLLSFAGIIVCLSMPPLQPMSHAHYTAIAILAILQQLLWGVAILKGLQKRRPYALSVMLVYLLFMGGIIHDVLVMIHFLSDNNWYLFIGFTLFLLSFSMIFLRQTSDIEKRLQLTAELEATNRELEKQSKEQSDSNMRLLQLYEETQRANAILKSDLNMARLVQSRILPVITELDSIHCSVYYSPVSDVGGDIYDIHPMSNGTVRFFLADATGHGVQAALVTMLIRNIYDSVKYTATSPAEILDYLNRRFHSAYRNLSLFFSCIVVDVDFRQQILRYSSAGHNPQLLLRGNNIQSLYVKGPIIGMIHKAHYMERETALEDHDRIFLFTDGIEEIEGNEHTMFGEAHLQKACLAAKEKAIEESITTILNASTRFAEGKNIMDDITILAIEKKK